MVVVVVAQDVLASALRHTHHRMALARDERVQVRQQALRALVHVMFEMCGKCGGAMRSVGVEKWRSCEV